MTPPAVPLPNVRSSVLAGRVSTAPPVVQLAAVPQGTLSPGVPTAASPSQVAAAASRLPFEANTATAAADNAGQRLVLLRIFSPRYRWLQNFPRARMEGEGGAIYMSL